MVVGLRVAAVAAVALLSGCLGGGPGAQVGLSDRAFEPSFLTRDAASFPYHDCESWIFTYLMPMAFVEAELPPEFAALPTIQYQVAAAPLTTVILTLGSCVPAVEAGNGTRSELVYFLHAPVRPADPYYDTGIEEYHFMLRWLSADEAFAARMVEWGFPRGGAAAITVSLARESANDRAPQIRIEAEGSTLEVTAAQVGSIGGSTAERGARWIGGQDREVSGVLDLRIGSAVNGPRAAGGIVPGMATMRVTGDPDPFSPSPEPATTMLSAHAAQYNITFTPVPLATPRLGGGVAR